MAGLRMIIGLLIAAAVAVALVPLAVLLDLHEGGTGWGLCDRGVEACTNSYFAGFEMLAAVALVLFAILALIAFCVRLMRWIERRKMQRAPR